LVHNAQLTRHKLFRQHGRADLEDIRGCLQPLFRGRGNGGLVGLGLYEAYVAQRQDCGNDGVAAQAASADIGLGPRIIADASIWSQGSGQQWRGDADHRWHTEAHRGTLTSKQMGHASGWIDRWVAVDTLPERHKVRK